MSSRATACGDPLQLTIAGAIESLFEELLDGRDGNKMAAFLAPLIKMSALQGTPASQALSFLFSLKKIIREAVGAESAEEGLVRNIRALETAIDGLALSACDIFSASRENIYAIQANELKRAHFRFLQSFERMHGAGAHKSGSSGEMPAPPYREAT